MRATGLVDGGVAELAKGVKEIGGLSWEDALIAEATERVLERLPFTDIERITGRDQLGEKLCELSQLD